MNVSTTAEYWHNPHLYLSMLNVFLKLRSVVLFAPFENRVAFKAGVLYVRAH